MSSGIFNTAGNVLQNGNLPPPPPPPTQNQPLTGFAAFVARYKDDPVGFARECLDFHCLPWQAELFKKVASGERHISVVAGHGVGKTKGCCVLVLWYMFTRYPQKTVITAPTQRQLDNAFLPDLKDIAKKLPPAMQAMLNIKSERIEFLPNPDASFATIAVASNDRPESLAGVHSENVLMIVDEASGVPDIVYKMGQGSMSGKNACTILIGNPTKNSGYFYKTHHDWKRNPKNPDPNDWATMHVSCVDIPVVDKQFVQKIMKDWGETSNEYKIRVLGEFASSDENTLIPAGVVDDAFTRDVERDPTAELVIGVDVARFGTDRTVLCYRRGNIVEDFKSYRNLDVTQVAGIVEAEARTLGAAMVLVDSIGVGGGVADILRRNGINARDVNVSEASALNPNAFKLRDDLWIALKNFLMDRACKLPQIDGLREELVAPTYTYSAGDKIVVEPKDSLRKRLSRSPDLADALCLTFASKAARMGSKFKKPTDGPLRRKNRRGIV